MRSERKTRIVMAGFATLHMALAVIALASPARAEQTCFYDWSPSKGTWYHCVDPGPSVYNPRHCKQSWDPVNGEHRDCRIN